MKPKPFSELNHLTVPCAMFSPLGGSEPLLVSDSPVGRDATTPETLKKQLRSQWRSLRACEDTSTKNVDRCRNHSRPGARDDNRAAAPEAGAGLRLSRAGR